MSVSTKRQVVNIATKLEDINTMYLNSAASNTISVMLLGGMGTGKTVALATAPKPLAIDVFDPGGMKSILPQIKEGGIYPTLYDVDEKDKPFAFSNWLNEFNSRVKEGFFDYIATYAIDSFTYWLSAALMYEKHEAEKAGIKRYRGLPALDDYRLTTMQLVQVIQKIMTLPCNFILTAHITKDKDELTGKYISTLVANPMSQKIIPAAFDEVYIMQVDMKLSPDRQYMFRTETDGMYECRSRLATKQHLLDKLESADFKHILKKVGLPFDDKIIE